jgi:multiple sugar transport system permease protein
MSAMPEQVPGHAPRPGAFARDHALPILVTAVFLLPLVWIVSASLRLPGLPPARTIEWIPSPVAIQNYGRIFDLLPFGRYIANSVLVAAIAVPLTLLTASMAGFAIAQLDRVRQRQLVVLTVALLMVPISALWLTRYVVFQWVGLIDSFAALVAPAIMGSSPLFVLLFYWSFRRFPAELFETARLEGAGAFTVWRRIAMPLAVPTIVAVSILAFLLYWSDFVSPLLYLKSQDLYTLPMGLRQLQQLDRTNWPLLMAASVVLAVPTVAVFSIAQRWFLRENQLTGLNVS